MTNILPLITAGAIWSKVWPILIAILFFGLLIFFHELGHFTVAKIFKIKINEFSMGMGPVLFKKKKGETQYSVRLFPIGGFVAMEGENTESDDERAFCNQKAWKRFFVIIAGGTVNVIMGIIIVMLMLATTNNLISTTEIHSFSKDATSPSYGLKAGDEFYKINGHRVFSGEDVEAVLA